MEKPILLEEINSMKYLLGYKRGVVISEQDDDNSIDPKLVDSVGQQVTTTQPEVSTPPVTTINIGVKNPAITELQNSLNTKFQSGLTPDGKYGPKTASSILTALQKLTGNNTEKPTDTTNGDQSSEANDNTQNNGQNKTQEVVATNNFSETDLNSII